MLVVTEKANQALTKRHNARLVLKTIYSHEPASRADIARLTNLTATTVSNVISELISDGVVEEVGSLSTERGKPPVLVGLRKNARHVIALNLAQNVFRGGILNLRGELLHQITIPSAGLQGDEALAAVHRVVEQLLAVVDRPLLGIGVGAPGLIDVEQGVIGRAVNLNWYELPLARLLNERYQLPSHIVNDNHAALLAESLFGQAQHQTNFIVVRVGRGVGVGLMINGQLVQNYGAGEIGHNRVVEAGERCTCGNHGCLETVASSRAIVQQACRLASAHPHSLLARLQAQHGEPDIQLVIQAYQAGDDFLGEIVERAGTYLGIAIAHLVGALAPSQIFLCGSVANFGEPLLERIRHEVADRSLTAQFSSPKIDLATSETDIIMLGATALLLQQELGLF